MTHVSSERPTMRGPVLATKEHRRMALQVTCVLMVLLLAMLLVHNLVHNLGMEGVSLGFGFLTNVAGFDVNESVISYDAGNSYLRALVVGTLNTLHLTLVCIALSTAIGILAGMLQLSDLKVFGIACRLYVDTMRNLPKLLILLAVYVLLVVELPVAREAYSLFDVFFVSNRGVNLPSVRFSVEPLLDTRTILTSGLFAITCFILWRVAAPRLASRLSRIYAPAGLFILIGAFGTGVFSVELPVFSGFNFQGGTLVSLPFLALALALGVYHGAQVTEVVRSGISSVQGGQLEAGRALGLSKGQVFWLVVMPQALRVMIPPLTNQYLNILKNTSIGLAVGYSDLVSVMNTSINQTFRPVELMLVSMSVYLVIGLAASALLNSFNRRVQLKER